MEERGWSGHCPPRLGPEPVGAAGEVKNRMGDMNRFTTGWPLLGGWGWSLALVLALAGGFLTAANGEPGSLGASAAVASSQAPQPRRQSRLEWRVSTLAKALDLNEAQQAQLRTVLEWQRQQVRKVWNDSAVPPDYRVTVAHAISDRTAEQIRGLLNEQQRNKYKLPRQPRPAAAGEGQRTVEDWMNAMDRK